MTSVYFLHILAHVYHLCAHSVHWICFSLFIFEGHRSALVIVYLTVGNTKHILLGW